MSRPNLARLEPSAYQVLAVADPVKVASTTEQVLGELDLDHLCRLLIRSERSLSLVNRRSFAAALADVPATANKGLRPAPPFHEAVSVAREDGKVLERTRQFLSQNPRALEELTPELTLALLRHFDPNMRMRPTTFTRNFVAVGSVTIIALIAGVLGIVHTQQNAELAATVKRPIQTVRTPVRPTNNTNVQQAPADIARQRAAESTVAVPPLPAVAQRPVNDAAVPAAPVAAPATEKRTADAAPAPVASVQHIWHRPVAQEASSLFVPTGSSQAKAPSNEAARPAASAGASTQSTAPAANSAPAAAAAAATSVASAVPSSASSTAPASQSTASSVATAQIETATQDKANATAMVLRTLVSQNPTAKVDWIRAKKSNNNVITVTSQVRAGENVSQETYQLWNSNGDLTVMNHHSSKP